MEVAIVATNSTSLYLQTAEQPSIFSTLQAGQHLDVLTCDCAASLAISQAQLTSRSCYMLLACHDHDCALQVAYNPQVLLPCSRLGDTSEVLVQDASALAGPQEELTFWQLQVSLSRNKTICAQFLLFQPVAAPSSQLCLQTVGMRTSLCTLRHTLIASVPACGCTVITAVFANSRHAYRSDAAVAAQDAGTASCCPPNLHNRMHVLVPYRLILATLPSSGCLDPDATGDHTCKAQLCVPYSTPERVAMLQSCSLDIYVLVSATQHNCKAGSGNMV